MTPPPDVKLAELLRELFDVDELQRFLRSQYRDVADGLSTNLGLLSLAHAAAEALARRNLIDDTLFTRLRDERPRCAVQIATAARLYRQAAARRVRSRRITAVSLVAAASVAGIIVMVWTHLPAGAPECVAADGCVEQRHVLEPLSPGVEPVAARVVPTKLQCPADMVFIHSDGMGPLCLDRSEVTRGQFCASAPDALACADRATKGLRPTLPVTHVRPGEAAAYCRARGLRLPRRQEYGEILRLELAGRTLASVLPAMNVCGDECLPRPKRDKQDFVHHDLHERTADVGSYRAAFASPLGLDDMFGNVREIVTDADRYFACGSGYGNAQLADLRPEVCLDPENRPLAATSSVETVGFRCAGEPTAVPP